MIIQKYFFLSGRVKGEQMITTWKKAMTRTTKNCLLCLSERKNNLSGKCWKLCWMTSWNWNGVPLIGSLFRKKKILSSSLWIKLDLNFWAMQYTNASDNVHVFLLFQQTAEKVFQHFDEKKNGRKMSQNKFNSCQIQFS